MDFWFPFYVVNVGLSKWIQIVLQWDSFEPRPSRIGYFYVDALYKNVLQFYWNRLNSGTVSLGPVNKVVKFYLNRLIKWYSLIFETVSFGPPILQASYESTVKNKVSNFVAHCWAILVPEWRQKITLFCVYGLLRVHVIYCCTVLLIL